MFTSDMLSPPPHFETLPFPLSVLDQKDVPPPKGVFKVVLGQPNRPTGPILDKPARKQVCH